MNISTANLTWLYLPERITATVTEAGLQPQDVMLEVTESRLIQDLAAALEVLTSDGAPEPHTRVLEVLARARQWLAREPRGRHLHGRP